MNVAVTVNDQITPSLDELAKQYPQFYRAALKDLGRRWRNTIGKEMRAGAPAGQPFAPLHPLTVEKKNRLSQQLMRRMMTLQSARSAVRRGFKKASVQDQQWRAVRAKETNERISEKRRQYNSMEGFGGKLPNLVEYNTNDGVRVGFLAGIFEKTKRSAARWMRQEQRAWTRQERHWLHGIYGRAIPFASYARPERQAVSPQEARWNQEAERVIRESLMKRLQNAQNKKSTTS